MVDGGPGTATLGLRGLGPARTLILINGQRLAPSGVQGAVSAVDLNALPPQIVLERFEWLRDGASPLYGSDAVAGVVNIVTRRKMGLEIFGANAVTGSGAGARRNLELGLGHGSGRLQLLGAIGYAQTQALELGDLPWAQCQVDGFRFGGDAIDPRTGQSKCYPVTGPGDNGATINTISTTTRAGVGAAGAVGTSFNRWRPNLAVNSGVVGWEGVGNAATSLAVRDTFDGAMWRLPAISPQDLYRGYVSAQYDLQALGQAQLYGSLLLSSRESSQVTYRQLSLDYPKGSPLIPAALQFSTLLPLAGSSAMNPLSGTGLRAFVGVGLNHWRQSVRNLQADGGLRGKLGAGDWRYDLHLAYTLSDGRYYQQQFLTSRLARSAYVLADGAGGFVCADRAGGCVAMPALNAASLGGQFPESWRNYVQAWIAGRTLYETHRQSITLDGTALRLPHGPVKLALGAELIHLRINDTPAPESVAGDVYNSSSAAPSRGTDRQASLFAEAQIPLLGQQRWAQELGLQLAARATSTRSAGEAFTYKAVLRYAPLRALALRAGWGTSFRAPSLKDLFQGATLSFPLGTNDPCNGYTNASSALLRANCAAAGLPADFLQTRNLSVYSQGGAASGLRAETATNLNLGATFRPDLGAGHQLQISADYYHTIIRNGIERAGYAYILNSCYSDPNFGTPQATYCRLVNRNPATGALSVLDNATNIARQEVAGLDLALRFQTRISAVRLGLEMTASHFFSQSYQLFPDQNPTQFNGSVRYPRWTGEARARAQLGGMTALYGVSFVGPQSSYGLLRQNPEVSPFAFATPAYWLHRASVQFALRGFDWVIGVENLFDTPPPAISSGLYARIGNAPLYSGYDTYGRVIHTNVTVRF